MDVLDEETQRRIGRALKSPVRAMIADENDGADGIAGSPMSSSSSSPRRSSPRKLPSAAALSPLSRTPFKAAATAASAAVAAASIITGSPTPKLQRSASKLVNRAAQAVLGAVTPSPGLVRTRSLRMLKGTPASASTASLPGLAGTPLRRRNSVARSSSTLPRRAPASHQSLYWHTDAAPELLSSISKDELQRQELIYELIQSEESYVKDLNVIVNVRPKVCHH